MASVSSSSRRRNQPAHDYYLYHNSLVLVGDDSSSSSTFREENKETTPAGAASNNMIMEQQQQQQQQQQPLLLMTLSSSLTSPSWPAAVTAAKNRRSSSSSTALLPGAVAIQGIHGDENEEEESPISVGSPSTSGSGQGFFFMSHSHSLDEEDAQVQVEESLQNGGSGCCGSGMMVQEPLSCGGPFTTTDYISDDIFFTTTTNRAASNSSSSATTVRVVARFWNDAIQKHHAWILLLVVFVIWPTAGFYYYNSSNSTSLGSLTDSSSGLLTLATAPPQNSPSATALDALRRNYYYSQNHNDDRAADDDDGWRHDPSRPAIYVVLRAKNTPTTNSTTVSSSESSSSSPFASLTRPDTEARHAARDFFDALNRTIFHEHCFHFEDDDPSSPKKCLDASTWLRATSFYSMTEGDEKLSWLARTTLATPGGKHVLMNLEYRYTGQSTSDELVQVIRDFLQAHQSHHENSYFTAHATGMPFLQRDLADSAQANITTMVRWCATLPAVSLLLVMCVMMLLKVLLFPPANQNRPAQSSSSSVLLLQDCSLVTSVLPGIAMTLATFWTAMSIERILMHHIFSNNNIHYWTPVIMTCLTVGLCIKYTTMILLDGYLHDQPQEQQERSARIGQMLETSAPCLVFSTVAMIMTIFASPLYYSHGLPPLFQSVAIGVCVAVMCTLLVHLTLVPALLYAYAQGGLILNRSKEWWNTSKTPGQARATTTTPLLLHHHHQDYYYDDDDDLDSPRMENGASNAIAASSIFRQQQPQGSEIVSPVPIVDNDNSTTSRRRTGQDAWHSWLSLHLLHSSRRDGGSNFVARLVVALFVIAPVAWHAKDLNSTLSISPDLLLPANSPSLETLRDLARQFNTVATTTGGSGRDDHGDDSPFASSNAAGSPFLNPYQILFDGHAVGRKMASSEGFDIMQRVVDELMAIDRQDDTAESDEEEDMEDHTTHIGMSLEDAIPLFHDITVEMERVEKEEEWLKCADDRRLSSPTSSRPTTIYNGIAVLHNTRIPYVMYSGGKLCMQMKRGCPTKLMHVVDALDKLLTTRDEFGTIITATLGVDPFSRKGREWLQEARTTIQRMQQGGALEGVEVYIHGTAAMTHDAAEAVHGEFPFMIRFMIIAVLLLMGLSFQSIFLPLQSLVTIGLTVGFSFGLASLAIQKGRLNTALGKEVCWLVPTLALCLIFGLSLEQDVFRSSRMQQYHRLAGSNHKSGIAAGVNVAGGVIMTSSGISMALTFGSLLMFSATIPALKQLGFIIATAVLSDSLVIRPLIASILSDFVLSRFCWWPRHDSSSSSADHYHHVVASKRRLSEYL